MRKRKNKDTIHYNGESSNVELLYRIFHSANQLCVYGAVTNWCETLGRTEAEKREKSGHELNRRLFKERNVNTEEVSSLVKIPRAPPASENRMHQKLQSFELLSETSKLKHIYDRAGFYHPVGRSKYIWLVLMMTIDWDILLQCAQN